MGENWGVGEDTVWRLDAIGQAALVRSGEIGAVELVEAALARAEDLAELHAVTVLFPDRARREAAQAAGPFASVPILLKDAGQEVAGTPLWIGTAALKNFGYTSTETTELAARLEGLGFVIIGKAAVPELMTGITTEPPIGPASLQPIRGRTTGRLAGRVGARPLQWLPASWPWRTAPTRLARSATRPVAAECSP